MTASLYSAFILELDGIYILKSGMVLGKYFGITK